MRHVFQIFSVYGLNASERSMAPLTFSTVIGGLLDLVH